MSLSFDQDFKTGAEGAPEKVREIAARTDIAWTDKKDILLGCFQAAVRGNLNNLQEFIGGYIVCRTREAEKNKGKKNKDPTKANSQVEDIYNLLFAPAMQLIEDSKFPATTLQTLMGGVPPRLYKATLNLFLHSTGYSMRHGSRQKTIAALLHAGADANTHRGSVIYNCCFYKDEVSLKRLHQCGGDFIAAANNFPARAEILQYDARFKQETIDNLTARNRTLQQHFHTVRFGQPPAEEPVFSLIRPAHTRALPPPRKPRR